MLFEASDYSRPQINSRALCAAATIDGSTLKNWLSRSPAVIVLTTKEKQDYGARRAAFSLSRTLHIAAIAELVAAGYELKHAVNKLAQFWYVAGSPNLPNEGERLPGELYKSGLSLLICSARDEPGRLMNFKSKSDALLPYYLKGVSATVLDMSALDVRVRTILTAFDNQYGVEVD